MPTFAEITIIVCVVLMAYASLLYPVLLFVWSKFSNVPVSTDENYLPEFTIVLSAYNEERNIAKAIESVFSSDYPPEKIKLLIGSDGSMDNTVAVAQKMADTDDRITVFDFPRSGKNRVLNMLIPLVRTDFVIFMDADHRPAKDVFRKLITPYADPKVGGTIPQIIPTGDDDSGETAGGEGFYQRYESFLRDRESALGTTVNSIGIYSMRTNLIDRIPNDYVCDDMFNVLTLAIKRTRFVYVYSAEVFEARSRSVGGEMKRRVRLSAGGLSAVRACSKLLNPSYGRAWLFFVSHKVIRYFLPVFLILIASATLTGIGDGGSIVWTAFWIQIAFYAGAMTGYILEKTLGRSFVFKLPLFAFSLCLGFALGTVRALRRGQNAMWETVYVKK